MSATTETHCHAAELLWEEQMGETFRQAMRDATGRDCVCHQEKPCWLMDRALELLAPTVAEQSWNVKFLALCDSVGEDRKHLIFEYLARGLDDTVREEQLSVLDRPAKAAEPLPLLGASEPRRREHPEAGGGSGSWT